MVNQYKKKHSGDERFCFFMVPVSTSIMHP
jgi:hypothetical protein